MSDVLVAREWDGPPAGYVLLTDYATLAAELDRVEAMLVEAQLEVDRLKALVPAQ